MTQEFGPAARAQPVFLFPVLACRSQAQHPPKHPLLPPGCGKQACMQVAAGGVHMRALLPAASLGNGEFGRNSPPDAIRVLCAQHHAGRAGSSLSATTGHSYQPLGHRGSSELAVVPPRQSGSYSQDGDCLSEAVPTPMIEAFESLEVVCVCVCVCITRSCQGDLFLFSVFLLLLHPLQSSLQHQDPTAWVLPTP